MRARDEAFRITGHAGAAHMRANGVNGTGRPLPDLARQGEAAIAVTSHATFGRVDQFYGHKCNFGILFQCEARPAFIIRAARTATLAIKGVGFRNGTLHIMVLKQLSGVLPSLISV